MVFAKRILDWLFGRKETIPTWSKVKNGKRQEFKARPIRMMFKRFR